MTNELKNRLLEKFKDGWKLVTSFDKLDEDIIVELEKKGESENIFIHYTESGNYDISSMNDWDCQYALFQLNSYDKLFKLQKEKQNEKSN